MEKWLHSAPRIRTRGFAIAMTMVGLACTVDPIDPEVATSTGPALVLPACDASARDLLNFEVRLGCNAVVHLSTTDPLLVPVRDAVVDEWNTALNGLTGVPTLSKTAISGAQTVTITKGGSAGDVWTGQGTSTDGDPQLENINLARFTSNPAGGPLLNVFLHEIVHVYGFLDAWDGKNDDAAYARPGVSTNCVRLTVGGVPNSSLCQHEIEDIAYVYGLRATRADPAKHILTGLTTTVGTTVLTPGGTTQASIASLLFDRGMAYSGGQGCGGGLCVPPVPEDLTYAWSSSDPSVVGFGGGAATGTSVTLVAGTTGTATITATVTSFGSYQPGTLFGNGGNGTSFTVSVMSGADLSLGNYTVPNVALGTSATVTYNSSNVGTGTATAPWTDRFYLSADASLNRSADTLLGSNLVNLSQTVGQTVPRSVTITIPATYNVGTRRLIGAVDDADQVIEANEGNNINSTPTINITYAPGKDLTILNGFGTYVSGQWTGFSMSARNIGEQSLGCLSLRYRYYLSTDLTLSANDLKTVAYYSSTCPKEPGEIYSTMLPPGLDHLGPFFGPTPPGTYYLFVKIDSENAISESNEANNSFRWPTQVIIN